MKNTKLIGVISVLAIIILLIGLVIGRSKEENEEYLKFNEKIEENYSSEIQLILDYSRECDYINISQKSAEQLVEFAHKNGIGTIIEVSTFGTVDYYKDSKLINAWTLKFYGEDNFFAADISEKDGEIYNIKYNNEIFYSKEDVSSGDVEIDNLQNDDNANITKPKETIWSGLNITIDGIEYSYPWNTNEFLNNGWEPNSSYHEELINEEVIPGEFTTFELDHSDYSCSLEIGATNTSSNNVKGYEATITDLYVGHFGDVESPLFEFYGIKAGDSKEVAKDIFGTPNDIYIDEYRGYEEYTYSTKLEDETIVNLILTFSINKNKLYEIEISILED